MIRKEMRRSLRVDHVHRRVLLHCPHDLYGELRVIARENQCSLEFVIRDALEHYIDEVIRFTAIKASEGVSAVVER